MLIPTDITKLLCLFKKVAKRFFFGNLSELMRQKGFSRKVNVRHYLDVLIDDAHKYSKSAAKKCNQ